MIEKWREEERKRLVETKTQLTFCGSLASLEKICGSRPFGGGGEDGAWRRERGTHTHTWQQGSGAAITSYSTTNVYTPCHTVVSGFQRDLTRGKTPTFRTLDEKALNTRDLHNTTTENDKRCEKEVIVLMKVLSIFLRVQNCLMIRWSL